jgi:hypothetical protein
VQLDEHASRSHGRPVLLVFLHNASGQVIGSSLCWRAARAIGRIARNSHRMSR